MTVIVPAPKMVSWFPESEAGDPVPKVKVTGLPDPPPVADRVMGPDPYDVDEGEVKVIDCGACDTVSAVAGEVTEG